MTSSSTDTLKASRPEQIAFDLRAPTPKTFSTFLHNAASEKTVSWLRNPVQWSMPIFLLIGDAGSGKSHLAHAFADEHDGRVLTADEPVRVSDCRGDVIALDDAQKWSEESLFILLNMALHGDIPHLLLTDRTLPLEWGIKLPDLRSRLNNVPHLELSQPDEILLEPIIKKLFADQGREIDKSVVDYMLVHCSRHISELENDVATIERAARAQKADVTKRFAAKVLKS